MGGQLIRGGCRVWESATWGKTEEKCHDNKGRADRAARWKGLRTCKGTG